MSEFNPKTLGQLLASPKAKDLTSSNVIEPKYDGHRVYLHVEPTTYKDGSAGPAVVTTWARGGTDKTGLIPEIEAEAAKLAQFGEVWLDGEVADLTGSGFAGADNWGTIQSVLGSKTRNPKSAQVTYMIFDCLMVQGNDTRPLPLWERREALKILVHELGNQDKIVVTPQFSYTEAAYTALLDAGYEGGVVKNPSAPYASGQRGYGWYRLKRTETIDVVVTGTIPGRGKFEGLLGALVFGAYQDGKLVNIGQCSGMIDRVRAEMTKSHTKGELVGTVVEVKHFGQSPQGGYRHPQYVRTRTDKAAEACLLSEVSAVEPNWNKEVS